MTQRHTFFPVVGESHHAAALSACQGRHQDRSFAALLDREPGNPFDHNAIAVKDDIGAALGYLDRDRAAEFCRALDAIGGKLAIDAELRGGTAEHPSIGVVFDAVELIRARDAIDRG